MIDAVKGDDAVDFEEILQNPGSAMDGGGAESPANSSGAGRTAPKI